MKFLFALANIMKQTQTSNITFRKATHGPGIEVSNHLSSQLGVQVSLITLIQNIVFISTLMLWLDVISSGMILTAIKTQALCLKYLKLIKS
jgi:hypothetical protein